MCVCVFAAIGCLTRQLGDAVRCPYLTSVSDGCTDTGQLNTTTHSTLADSENSHTLLAMNVSHSLPASTGTQHVFAAAGQLQPDPVSCLIQDRSVDQLSHLTQYPLSDLSSVLAEQTLVSPQTLFAKDVTQYPLSDSSSDSSRHAAEPESLQQFRLSDSPDNTTAAVHGETDNTTMIDRSSTQVKESSVQHISGPANRGPLSVNYADNIVEADEHGSVCIKSDNAAADGTDSIGSELADGQGKSDANVAVTDAVTKTLPPGAEIIDTVTDSSFARVSVPAVGSVIRLRDEKIAESGWTSLPVSVDPGCMRQHDVSSERSAVAAAAAGSSLEQLKSDGAVDDAEQTSRQIQLLLMETSDTGGAECLRNVVDGSEMSNLLSAAQTSVHVSVAHSSRPADDSAQFGILNGNADIGNDQSVTAQPSNTGVERRSVSLDHQHDSAVIRQTDGRKAEILASIDSQPQHSTTETGKPLDVWDGDLPLLLEQDSGREFDADDLAEDVKMILAKYRIRRVPIGSDSMPVASSENVDNVSVPDAIDPRDLDTCSSSSDDTLASRIKALLINAQNEKLLPTSQHATSASDVTSQSTSSVHLVSGSQNSSVDYSCLSRELDEIQMNLDNMRNSEKSSLGSHRSSDGLPRIQNEVVVTPESLAVLLQQKTRLDQLLAHSLVGHADNSLPVDDRGFISDADVGGTLRTESVLFEHQHRVLPSSVLTTSGTAKPLIALQAELDNDRCQNSNSLVSEDLLRRRTNVKTVDRSVQPLVVLLSNSTTAGPVSVSHMSVSSQTSRKSFESLGSRTELLGTVDDVEDRVPSIGSQNLKQFYVDKLASGQHVTESSGGVPEYDAVHYTVSEVSSMHTDRHQSDSASCTQLGSAHSDDNSVEAAVKQLKQNLANLPQSDTHDTSPTSDAYRYHREPELLKHLSAATGQQIPALCDDEYCLSEARLSPSCSASCDLLPVPKHSSINTMRHAHPLSSQLEKVAAVQFDRGIELQSAAASNASSSVWSLDRNVKWTENPTQLRTEHEKDRGYTMSNQLLSDNEEDRYMQESYSVSSNKEMFSVSTQFVSTADVQLTPLAQVPRGDSSDNGSYDGDNELPSTDRQNYDAAHSVQAVASYSPASVYVLQPYQ